MCKKKFAESCLVALILPVVIFLSLWPTFRANTSEKLLLASINLAALFTKEAQMKSHELKKKKKKKHFLLKTDY